MIIEPGVPYKWPENDKWTHDKVFSEDDGHVITKGHKMHSASPERKNVPSPHS